MERTTKRRRSCVHEDFAKCVAYAASVASAQPMDVTPSLLMLAPASASSVVSTPGSRDERTAAGAVQKRAARPLQSCTHRAQFVTITSR
eukprot:scaffold127594_cov69-Phaeocystis_antarctica.AAC.5